MNTQHRHRNSLITSPPYRPPGRAVQPGQALLQRVPMSQRASLLGYTLQAHAFSCFFSKGRGKANQSLLLLVQLLRLSLERP